MPTYQIITQLFYGKDQLSFYRFYIDATSPAQAMRKHNLPKRLKTNEQIIINITPLVRQKDDIPFEVHQVIDRDPSPEDPDLSPTLIPLSYPSEDQLLGISKKKIKKPAKNKTQNKRG
jgi:hypothetical protein